MMDMTEGCLDSNGVWLQDKQGVAFAEHLAKKFNDSTGGLHGESPPSKG